MVIIQSSIKAMIMFHSDYDLVTRSGEGLLQVLESVKVTPTIQVSTRSFTYSHRVGARPHIQKPVISTCSVDTYMSMYYIP